MELKTERVIAYFIAVVFFVVGIVCYAAFPERMPDEPVRIMFEGTAGDVLFSHKVHVSESGYGLDCGVCHHEDEDDPSDCDQCPVLAVTKTVENGMGLGIAMPPVRNHRLSSGEEFAELKRIRVMRG